ncbi:Fis family transcriptional regulator [Nocardia nova]|uniref:Fis family transcriptional regulator n=1 Tax=Nocardia nova TaxID=37330 RepID=A0A2S6A8Y0_9NOCA|nr:Fis family transcriptional regulator [Nocardia nova]PPJ29403.1 Fis family transcriptional regulator [Nocardia nova]
MNPNAHFTDNNTAVAVEHVVLRDRDVLREAQRWTSGHRGPIVDDPETLATADLSGFITEVVKCGAVALAATGQASDAKELERMVAEVGEKAAASAARAAELTGQAAKDASAVMTKTVDSAKKALAEADANYRKEMATTVNAATANITDQINRLFGGSDPELVARLKPVLEQFSAELSMKAAAGTQELIATATKQFDLNDPTSPIAKHTAALDARQHQMSDMLMANHADLAKRFEEMTAALKVREAKAALVSMTPRKGESFAAGIHRFMEPIAAGLGDEYYDTGAMVGALPRCKKGDGLLTTADGTRVVIEITDSQRPGWSEYLDEAERNRQAAASLGIVRAPEQNGGETLRVLGPRRVVLAFDPDTDEPDLLRACVLLMRAASATVVARGGGEQLATATEKVQSALTKLEKLATAKKSADVIRREATKIDKSVTDFATEVELILAEAVTALTISAEPTALAVVGTDVA